MNHHLRLKLRRDVRRHWSQFVAVLLMSALSVLVYTGLEGAWNGLRTQLDAYAAETDLADVWVRTTDAGPAGVAAIAGVAGVAHAEPATVLAATTGGTHLEAEVVGAAARTLSRPVVRSGPAPVATADGIWVAEPFADARGLDVGDTLPLTIGGTTRDVTILGTILSPEHLYHTGTPALVAPDPATESYALVPENVVTELVGAVPAPNVVRVAAHSEAADGLAARVADATSATSLRVTDRTTADAVSTAFDRVDQIRNLSVLFSFIFVLLAILAMYTSTRRLVDMQRREIAVLKALGFPAASIGRHFASYGLVAGGLGAVAGLAIAPGMSTYVLGTQRAMLSAPTWRIAYTSVPLVVAALVVGVCVLGAYLAARPSLPGAPADQMRPGVAQGRRILLERATAWWSRTSYGSRWAWRDSGTNVTRFVMGVVGVGGSLMLLFAGFGMADSMNGQVTSAFVDEARYTARLSLAPGADVTALAATAGRAQAAQETVVRTTPSDAFDRVLTVLDEGAFVHLTTVDGEPARLAGAAVSDATAERLGLSTGDTLTLTMPAGGGTVDVVVDELLASSAPQGVTLTRAAWERLGQTFAPTTLLVGDDAPLDVLAADAGITRVLERSHQETVASDMVTDLGGIFMLIRVFAILLTVIVLYSLGSLAFTERVRDYATLKVLGFGTGDLRRLAARENVTATVLGLAVGIPAGLWFLGDYVGTFSTPRLEYTAQITLVSVVVAMAIAAGFSLLTTFLLGRRIARVDMVGALKGVE